MLFIAKCVRAVGVGAPSLNEIPMFTSIETCGGRFWRLLLATGVVYSTIPAIGNLIFGHLRPAVGCGMVAVGCAGALWPLVKMLAEESTVSGIER